MLVGHELLVRRPDGGEERLRERRVGHLVVRAVQHQQRQGDARRGGHRRVLGGQGLGGPARRGDVVHERVGHVGLHHRLVVREVLGPHRVADVAAGPEGGEHLGPEELQRLGLHGQREERRGEDERPHVAGALLREAGTDEPSQAVPEQHDGLARLPAAHLIQEDRRVVEVVVEPPDLAARTGRQAVPAQVVRVHRVAARGHVLPEPGVATAVVAVPVDEGDHGHRLHELLDVRTGRKPRLQVQALAGAHELVRRVPRSDGRGAHDVRSLSAARMDPETAARPPSSSSGSGHA